MGKQDENLKVICPCCQAKLVIDPAFGAVLSHEAHVRPGPDVDLTKASSILEEQKRQREDKFADSFFQETHKEDILAKKFEEAMKKAKEIGRASCRERDYIGGVTERRRKRNEK